MRHFNPLAALATIGALVGCGSEPVRPVTPAPAGITPSLSGTGAPFTQVSSGAFFFCGLRQDATLTCSGDNSSGQVSGVPAVVEPYDASFTHAGPYTQVSAGFTHVCALKPDGSVKCWGSNINGEITGTPSTTRPYYAEATRAGPYTQVSAGSVHTCALKSDGTATCWDKHGEWAPFGGTFQQVSAGHTHTCALDAAGVVTCDREELAPPAGTYSQVSAGNGYTCGVKTDGTVACGGDDFSGRTIPPAGLSGVALVSAGDEFHTCGLTTAGGIVCWGENTYGQATSPQGVYTQISAGYNHTCALKDDGGILCYGRAFTLPPPPSIAQAITFTSSPPSQPAIGATYTVTATGGGSGNPVNFSSLTPAVCAAGPSSGNASLVSLLAAGTCTVAADQAGGGDYVDAPQVTQSFSVVYAFGASTGGGFGAPVSTSTFNSVRAGQAVPVKFDLGGDQGLSVLASGYPQSVAIACPSGSVPVNVIPEATATTGGNALSYDAATGLYTYVWKTEKEWAGTCREFILKLADGTEHTARFQFAR